MAGNDPSSDGRRGAFGVGIRVAAIASVWAGLAVVGRYGVRTLGPAPPGSFLHGFGDSVAVLFVLTGVINVAVYLAAHALRRRRD